MVPGYILDKAWLEGNFIIPTSKELRIELYHRLLEYSGYGVLYLDNNAQLRKVLQARIAALEAYDAKL